VQEEREVAGVLTYYQPTTHTHTSSKDVVQTCDIITGSQTATQGVQQDNHKECRVSFIHSMQATVHLSQAGCCRKFSGGV